VASNNTAAITLYRRNRWADSGLRADYYTRKDGTKVDAVLMTRDLT